MSTMNDNFYVDLWNLSVLDSWGHREKEKPVFQAFVISTSEVGAEFNDKGMFIGDENHADDAFGGGSGEILGSKDAALIQQYFLSCETFSGCFISVFEFPSEESRKFFYKNYGTDQCTDVPVFTVF